MKEGSHRGMPAGGEPKARIRHARTSENFLEDKLKPFQFITEDLNILLSNCCRDVTTYTLFLINFSRKGAFELLLELPTVQPDSLQWHFTSRAHTTMVLG